MRAQQDPERNSTSADQMPAPTGALDAGLRTHFPRCGAGLAFIPYLAKATLKSAGAPPAVKRLAAPMVRVLMFAAKCAANITDGQRLWSLDLPHVSLTPCS